MWLRVLRFARAAVLLYWRLFQSGIECYSSKRDWVNCLYGEPPSSHLPPFTKRQRYGHAHAVRLARGDTQRQQWPCAARSLDLSSPLRAPAGDYPMSASQVLFLSTLSRTRVRRFELRFATRAPLMQPNSFGRCRWRCPSAALRTFTAVAGRQAGRQAGRGSKR